MKSRSDRLSYLEKARRERMRRDEILRKVRLVKQLRSDGKSREEAFSIAKIGSQTYREFCDE